MNKMIFDDIDTEVYGFFCLGVTQAGAERDYEVVEVQGRNGDLHLDNGRYKNVQVVYHLVAMEDAETRIDNLNAALLAHIGYFKLSDTFHPSIYRLAEFRGGIEPEMRLTAGKLDIAFDCKPQKFLVAGDEEQTVTASGTISNPTLYDAKPLLTITGTGSVQIGNRTITISTNPDEMTIDCDLEEAYNAATLDNYNSYITTPDGFPILASGDTGVVADGVTVKVKPRFYTL